MCLQPGGSDPQGNHIPKDCKFCWKQALGDTTTDDLESVEDGDVHSRLAHITQENQMIKAQLSQLMELVQQLLPQQGQATQQPAGVGSTKVLSPPAEDQATSTSGAEVGLPPPLLSSHIGQHSVLPHGNPLPAVPVALALPARQVATTDAQLQQPWPSPASPGTPVLGSASSLQQVSSGTGLPLAQVSTSLQGKIQCDMWISLSY